MAELKRALISKPTLHTPFHIDYDWWKQNDRDWQVYLYNLLCPEHQKLFGDGSVDEIIDWVDPQTAEVHPVNGLHHVIMEHCANQPEFLAPGTPLVDLIFRVFLANGNTPLTPIELSERLGRPAQTILTVLSGNRVYRGLRPIVES
ncbi:MAG: hypothetical protein RML93_12845 [Anaerolineales bacterium]|nr:hypothetical protein [Anaerolineales bacterium]MCS7246880.1 hypothetical protein [Anaerolineales bacterium]MDW8160691.1 hypothetical protein [Anaerolineales bacterium]MDW8448163.1 hypothetical protein [Anaerolineales bacterium]